MFEILALLAPIGLLIGMGFTFLRFGWFPVDGLPVLNRFVMNACVPVLLFSAVSNVASLADFAWLHSVIYAAASLSAAAMLWVVLRYVLREAPVQAIILSLGAGVSNTILLGYPIAAAFIPERATEVFAWVVLAEVLFIIPIITTWAQFADQDRGTIGPVALIKPYLSSPVTIGLFSGLLFVASGFALPSPFEAVIDMIVKSAPFLALFLIGGTLTQVRISRTGPRILVTTAAKLFIHPISVFIAFAVFFGGGSQDQLDATLFAAIPIFTSYLIFCARHSAEDVAASSIVLSTLIGAVTVTVFLTLIQ